MHFCKILDTLCQKPHAGGKGERSSLPPLTVEEAMREDEVVVEIHTSASDVGGASSTSTLWEPPSCLLPSLDCPEWGLAPED